VVVNRGRESPGAKGDNCVSWVPGCMNDADDDDGDDDADDDDVGDVNDVDDADAVCL
jgi:hypothetical protein